MRAKCLGCGTVAERQDAVTTASPDIVRIECGVCRGKAIATVIRSSPGGMPVDLVAEAERIFADVLADPIVPPVSDAHREAREAAASLAAPSGDAAIERDDRVQEAYRTWLRTENGRLVSVEVRDRALAERSMGKSRASIQRLAEIIRDEAVAAGRDADGYRVNNSHLSRLARDLMLKYPELEGFFEVRELRSREVAECRSCGAPIAWGETRAGKRVPLNPDGTTHFATCPDASSWSRRQPAKREAKA